jgi:hypothetical protein
MRVIDDIGHCCHQGAAVDVATIDVGELLRVNLAGHMAA